MFPTETSTLMALRRVVWILVIKEQVVDKSPMCVRSPLRSHDFICLLNIPGEVVEKVWQVTECLVSTNNADSSYDMDFKV